MGLELLSLVEYVNVSDLSDQELFDCNNEKLTHRKTITSLEKVIQKIEVEDKERFAKLSPTSLVNTEAGHIKKSNLLKLKVSLPKFSGKSRDFAIFKRDFKSIVTVDERSPIEIGALLKESIPSN